MYSLLFLGFTAFVLSLFLTPLVRNVFGSLGVVDQPDNQRKLHKKPIPRVGGIAIALAYGLAFALLIAAKFKSGQIIVHSLPFIIRLFPAAALMFLTGLLDDLIHLKPWQKLLGQVVAAYVAYCGGIQIHAIGRASFDHWWSLPATIIWLVACANAVNLIDGLDGLAAGVGFLSTITMLLASLMQQNVDLALATLPLACAILGFLRYNFNPATVFLGDCGSLFIGFLLGCYGVLWSQKSTTILGMTAPLLALSVPLLDTCLAITRRFLGNKPIFGADRGHIHHRLLDRGFTPRRVALVLYALCAIGAMLSLFMIANHRYQLVILVVFCVVAWLGIQRLGFIEFDLAGKLILQGSFRRLLSSQISLHSFQTAFESAQTIEECWSLLKLHYREFGFSEIRMRIEGTVHLDCAETSNGLHKWRIEIPISTTDYVSLTMKQGDKSRYDVIAQFADLIHRVLSDRIQERLSEVAEPVGNTPEPFWRTVSAAKR